MSREYMVGTRLSADVVRDLETIEHAEQSDRSTTVRKLLFKAILEWKLEHHARLYGDGRQSLARAAESAGVSLWEMMDYARQRRISAQYDLDDFQHDVSVVRSRVKVK